MSGRDVDDHEFPPLCGRWSHAHFSKFRLSALGQGTSAGIPLERAPARSRGFGLVRSSDCSSAVSTFGALSANQIAADLTRRYTAATASPNSTLAVFQYVCPSRRPSITTRSRRQDDGSAKYVAALVLNGAGLGFVFSSTHSSLRVAVHDAIERAQHQREESLPVSVLQEVRGHCGILECRRVRR